MGTYTEEYKKLLIVQYADKPNALSHTSLMLSKFEEVFNLVSSFEEAFDLDTAVGKQLDILGKIVGISRTVPFAVPKNNFGFFGGTYSFPMNDKFLNIVSYPFKDKFEIPYSTGELNDNDYRFFIKAKIIKNNVIATMINSNSLSLQNAIDYLFEGKGYIVDNYNMSMTIYIENTFNFDVIQYIQQLDLIPRPQGVLYKTIISYVDGKTFGFGVNNTGFGDKFDGIDDETYFAEKVI